MDDVRHNQLRSERRDDVCEQDDALGDIGTDQIQGRGQHDHIEDIIDQAYPTDMSVTAILEEPVNLSHWGQRSILPNSQNATQTRGSAPLKMALKRFRNRAHEHDGVPGKGNMDGTSSVPGAGGIPAPGGNGW